MKEALENILQMRNITSYRLSKMTGIPTGVLSSFNTGRVKSLSYENLEKIAIALEVSLDIFRAESHYSIKYVTSQEECYRQKIKEVITLIDKGCDNPKVIKKLLQECLRTEDKGN